MRHRFVTVFLGALLCEAAGAQPATFQQVIPRQFPVARIPDQCIEFSGLKQGNEPGDFLECRVTESGELGEVDGQLYSYALYCLIPADRAENAHCGDKSFRAVYSQGRGMAIFAHHRSGENALVLFERADPEYGIFYFERPEIVPTAAGTVLYLPTVMDGTGHGNGSEYYLRESEEWRPIDNSEWLAELKKRLPQGLEIWKGIWPDLRTMQAETGLYRSGDANCCPTAAIVHIQLAIRSRQFVLEAVVIELGPIALP